MPTKTRAIEGVAAIARRFDIPLTLVRMPEHRVTIESYDEGVQDRFLRFLEKSGEVLDLLDAVPDEGFMDQAHPNELGRQVATERLAEYLAARD
jgi:hypothetical protein